MHHPPIELTAPARHSARRRPRRCDCYGLHINGYTAEARAGIVSFDEWVEWVDCHALYGFANLDPDDDDGMAMKGAIQWTTKDGVDGKRGRFVPCPAGTEPPLPQVMLDKMIMPLPPIRILGSSPPFDDISPGVLASFSEVGPLYLGARPPPASCTCPHPRLPCSAALPALQPCPSDGTGVSADRGWAELSILDNGSPSSLGLSIITLSPGSSKDELVGDAFVFPNESVHRDVAAQLALPVQERCWFLEDVPELIYLRDSQVRPCARSHALSSAPQLCSSALLLSSAPQLCSSALLLSSAPQPCSSALLLSSAPQLCSSSALLLSSAPPQLCSSALLLSSAPQLCSSVF